MFEKLGNAFSKAAKSFSEKELKEKDRDSTINFLELRLKEMQVALQETSNQKQQIAASLEQGKQQMEQLLATRGKK